MNKVILCGRLTRDVEIRDAANNTTIARVGIAVDRPFKKDEADFFNLVAFNKRAEFLEKYFEKGSRILVEGYLRTDNYEDKEGVKRSRTEIIVDQIEFADSKRKGEHGAGGSEDRSYRRNSSTEFTPPPDLDDSPF